MLRSIRPLVTLAAVVAFSVPAACSVTQSYELPPSTDGGNSPGPDVSVPTLPDGVATCDTLSDPESCGTCGHSCGGGSCSRGVCAPVRLASDGAILHLVLDASDAYWINAAGEVRTVPLRGGAARTLAKVDASGEDSPAGGAQNATHVFFAVSPRDVGVTGVASRLVSVSKADGTVTVLGEVSSPLPVQSPNVGAKAVAIEGDQVVWLSAVQGASASATRPVVSRCPSSGCAGAPEVLVNGDEGDAFASLALRGSSAIVANFARGRVERRLPDGVVDVFLTVPLPEGLATDEKHLFVLTSQPESSQRNLVRCEWPARDVVGLGCSGPLTVMASGGRVSVFAVTPPVTDASHVVWANVEWSGPVAASIMRCPKDGAGCGASPEVLVELGVDVRDRPFRVAVDATSVYWSNLRGELFKLAKPAADSLPPR